MINVVCGKLVDEIVFVCVLVDGMIVGVGFDVFVNELNVLVVLFEFDCVVV